MDTSVLVLAIRGKAKVELSILIEFLCDVALKNLEALVNERCSAIEEVSEYYDEWVAYIGRVFKNDIPLRWKEEIEKSRRRCRL